MKTNRDTLGFFGSFGIGSHFGVLTLLLVAGCGSGGAGSPQEFITQYTNSICAIEARCGAVGASEKGDCVKFFTNTLGIGNSFTVLQDSISANRAVWNAAKAQACLDSLNNVSCGSNALLGGFAACSSIATGLVAAGGICKTALDCAAGTCVGASGTALSAGCAGTCRAFTAVGAMCDFTSANCDHNSYCDALTSVCKPYISYGMPCGMNDRCANGSQCAAGFCGGATARLGEACSVGLTNCADGLYCDSVTNPGMSVCATKVAAGAACTYPVGCVDGYVCIGITETVVGGRPVINPGKCGAFLDLNSGCDPTSPFAGCPSDMMCDATKKSCQLSTRSVVGSSCAMSTCNGAFVDLYCEAKSKTCAARVALGQPCTAPTDCVLGATCDATSKTCAMMCN